MTENTLMSETTETTLAPTTNTFGKAFKNVVLFPFRAVKFIIKWGFKAVLALLIIFTLLYMVNAATPMDVLEAQGMTTYQLYGDRFKVMVFNNRDGQPLFIIGAFVLFPFGYFMGPFETMLCAYFPDGKFEKWTRKTVITGKEYYRFIPSLEPTLANLPKILKENIDRYTWNIWVISSYRQFPYPQPPANK